MLKVILNRLKPQAKKIIAEAQAGFRAGRSTTEQIFNLRFFCEKYLQHQQDLYHFFTHFKKAFDRVWHAALWATMKKDNISANFICVIKTSMTRSPVQTSSMAAMETGSEQQLESDSDVYSHPPSSKYFWKGSRQTPSKITKAPSALEAEQLPISALLMMSMAEYEKKKNW